MTLELKVPNMACSACAEKITNAVKAIDPGAIVQADPKTKLVHLDIQAPEAAVREAITTAGYTISDE
jgi:copper chaperone